MSARAPPTGAVPANTGMCTPTAVSVPLYSESGRMSAAAAAAKSEASSALALASSWVQAKAGAISMPSMPFVYDVELAVDEDEDGGETFP